MIKSCCFYCQKFKDDVCKDPICYNAFARPIVMIKGKLKEDKWYCQQYEGGECGETITNGGKMNEAHKECWSEQK